MQTQIIQSQIIHAKSQKEQDISYYKPKDSLAKTTSELARKWKKISQTTNMETGMSYEGDELVGTVHPQYARMP